jgi:GNAT superfamily N-acetyltransferase
MRADTAPPVTGGVFVPAQYANVMASIRNMKPVASLPQNLPRQGINPEARQVLSQALSGDFHQKLVERLQQKLDSGQMYQKTAADSFYSKDLAKTAGPMAVLGVDADGKYYFLSRFHEYLANLRDKDATTTRKLFAASFARLAIIDLLQESLQTNASGAIELTPSARGAIEKIARIYECQLAGDSKFDDDQSALNDHARLFTYRNRYDRMKTIQRVKGYVRSAPAAAEWKLEDMAVGIHAALSEYRTICRQKAGRCPTRGDLEYATATIRGVREYFSAERFHGMSELTVKRILNIRNVSALNRRIVRYRREYETIVGRIARYSAENKPRVLLERLNQKARWILARLLLLEMHPYLLERRMEGPQGAKFRDWKYDRVTGTLRHLIAHLYALRDEMLWHRVRTAGRREVIKHLTEGLDESSFIDQYLLGDDAFQALEGTGESVHRTLSPAAGMFADRRTQVSAAEPVRRLLSGEKVLRTTYERRSVFYLATVKKLFEPYWQTVWGFKAHVVKNLPEEVRYEVGTPENAEKLSLDEVADILSGGAVYETRDAVKILKSARDYILQHTAGDDEKGAVKAHFRDYGRPDIDKVGEVLGGARYRSIFDLLRSWNHTLSSYARANLAAYDMLGFLDDAANRYRALLSPELAEMEDSARLGQQIRGYILNDLRHVLSWSEWGIKEARRIAMADLEAAVLALDWNDSKTFEIAVSWARFHVQNYIDENVRIARYVAIKTVGLRDIIREPARVLLKGNRIQATKAAIEALREKLPARFYADEDEFGYQRTRARLSKLDDKLTSDRLDGRALASRADDKEHKSARRKYVEAAIQMEMVLMDVLYKKVPAEDYAAGHYEEKLRQTIERQLLGGQTVEEIEWTWQEFSKFKAKILAKSRGQGRNEMRTHLKVYPRNEMREGRRAEMKSSVSEITYGTFGIHDSSERSFLSYLLQWMEAHEADEPLLEVIGRLVSGIRHDPSHSKSSKYPFITYAWAGGHFLGVFLGVALTDITQLPPGLGIINQFVAGKAATGVIAVIPEKRGEGIGRQLWRHGLQWMRELSIPYPPLYFIAGSKVNAAVRGMYHTFDELALPVFGPFGNETHRGLDWFLAPLRPIAEYGPEIAGPLAALPVLTRAAVDGKYPRPEMRQKGRAELRLQSTDRNDRRELREVAAALLEDHALPEDQLTRFQTEIAQEYRTGNTPEVILKQLKTELDRWMEEHQAFIVGNREAILDALEALQEGVDETNVFRVLEKFGLTADVSSDIDARGMAKRVSQILAEARKKAVFVEADPSAPVTPGAMKMVKNLFAAITEVRQKVRVRQDLSVLEKIADENLREQQLSGAVNTARSLVLLNQAFYIEFLCRTDSEVRSVKKILLRGFNKNEQENASRILSNIKVLRKGRTLTDVADAAIPTIRIAPEILTGISESEMQLDGSRTLERETIRYDDPDDPDTLGKLMVLAAGRFAALSKRTVEALAQDERRVLRLRSLASLENLAVLLRMIEMRAVAKSA